MNERYQPKQFEESTRESCHYCHQIPITWQQSGNEKICPHCGTRVYNSALVVSSAPDAKYNER